MFTNRPAMNGRSGTASQPEQSTAGLDGTGAVSAEVYLIRDQVQRKLLNETQGDISNIGQSQMRQMIETFFNQVLEEERLIYTRNTRAKLLDWVNSDILGYGPIEPLLQDPTITEVMCNGPQKIYIERNG